MSASREKPHLGARKIRELLVRRLDQDLRIPAKSTIRAVLHRHGLVKGIHRGFTPNDLWCADVSGEFKLGNSHYCYALTVTDRAARQAAGVPIEEAIPFSESRSSLARASLANCDSACDEYAVEDRFRASTCKIAPGRFQPFVVARPTAAADPQLTMGEARSGHRSRWRTPFRPR